MTSSIENNQINQSISEIKKIMSDLSPLSALSNVYTSMAQVSGLNSLNAAANQQQLNIIGTAIVAAGANRILDAEPAEKGGKLSPDETLECLQKLVAMTTAKTEQATNASPDNANSNLEETPSSKPEDISSR